MTIDIIFFILLLLAFIYGFKKGLLHSIVSLIAITIGIMAAVYLSELAGIYINKWFHTSTKYLPLISFIVVFFLIYLLFRLLEKALEGFFKALQLNFINKIAGAIIWCVVWVMFYSTILFYLNNMKLLSEDSKKDSIVFEKVEPFAPAVIEFVGKIIPPVKNIFNSLEDWFREVAEGNTSSNTN